MIGHAHQRLRSFQRHTLLGLLLGITIPLSTQTLGVPAAAQGATQPVVANTERSEVAAGDVAPDDLGNDGIAPTANPPVAAPVPLTPATHGAQFAIGFPETWAITHGEANPQLTATAPTGESTITTEVAWYTQPPGEMVPTLLADIQGKGYTVTLYDAIALDSTTALRLWLADLPDPELPYAFMTIVGYSDATAVLISRYETRTPEVDNLLNQIHESFRRNDPNADSPEPHETHHP